MAARKVGLTASVRIDAYTVLRRAVEEGAAYGWRRAHKHTSTPTDDQAIEAIENAIMEALCEVLQFEEHAGS